MALLTLKDIGKIYVSEGSVAVGIRGVNLSFDRGEFVAVTGKSGSGKSTLLNVISGMDSYEEGEMYIEGETTSHYLQPEWEEYREKYISFIFQDYNIIESFTVLQNVELALMSIEDKKERRKRALELIDRVGLSSHIKQKGSKLSGGQKQRTVIARALAKDSPIILADEPTGNLDSVSSAEIIQLLKEVSKDKLLIVVTHNFEQVQDYATRHVRIFDGAVESDRVLSSPVVSHQFKEIKTPDIKKHNIKNGITLGKTIFTSKPKLSFFLCMLLILGTVGIFSITSFSKDAAALFEKHYMFEYVPGRVVVTTRGGEVPGEEEVKLLAEKHGAESYLRFDNLLDSDEKRFMRVQHLNDFEYFNANCVYGKDYGDNIIGEYPTEKDEVFMYLPISYQEIFGKDELQRQYVYFDNVVLKIKGVKYYYDNNITPECLFTNDGYKAITAISYFLNSSWNITFNISYGDKKGDLVEKRENLYEYIPTFELKGNDVYYKNAQQGADMTLTLTSTYYKYNYYYGDQRNTYTFTKDFKTEDFVYEEPVIPNVHGDLYISAEALEGAANEVLEKSYKQFSLFFANDSQARVAAEKLCEEGYIAVTSDATYTPEVYEILLTVLSAIFSLITWALVIVFLAFFINLCSSRTLSAFKVDMAIMRSMGISVRVIKIGMYVRMFISLIPAYIITLILAAVIFTTPSLNGHFMYLYAWQYALIFVSMLILTARTTQKQVKKLFGESVKKSLKRGNAE